MRPAKLYLEIFISFVLAIIVSETMIFFLFTDSERRIVGYKLSQNTNIKVQMLEKLVDEKIITLQETDPWGAKELRDLLASVETTYEASIWITNEEGIPLIYPRNGNIPRDIDLLDSSERMDPSTGMKLYNNISESGQVYTSIPLTPSNNETPVLYIAFNVDMPPHHRWQFSLGLLIIGTVVAILIIPVSKFITDRIKDLRISALRIAEGELSHRVSVKARDEIGELGIAFNQMAERLERMIVGGKELTANISHELRTPLARIRIAQEMLAERLEKGDFTKCERRLDEIREDIEELDTLIGRILELSKLDIHELGQKRVTFNPVDLLEEQLEKLGTVIAYKNLSVRKTLPAVPPMTGDRLALDMAFSNILDNAVKFTPETGDIHIALSRNGDSLAVRIVNTYEKVPEQDLEKIFEPFYRARKSNASGTGLGLSIAAKIIQKHGGTIRAFNASDGFEIRVELPMGERKQRA
jgi:two-component system sensor histidine kinase CpxA